ncbi:MAG: type I secretion system permease/ATPase [Pseudomonadota bacterium]
MSDTKPPRELADAVTALRPSIVLAAWFSVFAGLLILAPSAYMLEVYDRVVSSRSPMTLAMLTLLVLVAYALMEILDWARSETLLDASHQLDRHLHSRVFSAVFQARLQGHSAGNLQPLHDLRTLREFLYSPALMAALEAPVCAILAALMFAISPVLGWAAVIGALLQVGIGWMNDRKTQPLLAEANRCAISAQQTLDASLRNAQVIESMGMQSDVHRRWQARQDDCLGRQALASDRAGGFQAMTKFLQVALGSLLLGLGAWLLLHNELNGGAGMMIVGSILGGRVLQPLVLIVTQWRSVVNARGAWKRLDGLLKTLPPPAESMPLPAPAGRLQVESVSAAAPGSRSLIVKGVNFSLEPGTVLAVLGPSASGKTTLARLLVGLWPAAQGKVRLDGADVFTWDKQELGPHLGYLPQEVELLEGTIAENIARFGEIRMAKVRAAAIAVGLDADIMALPLGYDTPVGREGNNFSGGQRQRLGLARALYGEPTLVVLDEPNSSLDEAGDAALAAAIRELKSRGTTFVVMTHRTSVLGVADRILVLHDGVMQAFGARDEVLAALKKASDEMLARQSARQSKPLAEAA